MRPIPATRLGDAHGLLRAIEQRGRLRTDEFVTEFNLDELFPPGLENALGRLRHFISFGRLAGLVKEDRGVVELTDIGKRYVRSSDPDAPYDVSSQQAEWLRRQLRERHMTDSIFHGLAIGLSLLASVPPRTRISTMDFGRSMAYLGRAGWDNENTLLIQGERHLTLLDDLELIDGEHRLTQVGEQLRGELTLPVHMSLADIAAQLNPGGSAAVRAAAEAEFAAPAPEPTPEIVEEAAPVEPDVPTADESANGDGYQTVISSAAGGAESTQPRPPIVPRATGPVETPPATERPTAPDDPLLPFAGAPQPTPDLTPGDPLAARPTPEAGAVPSAPAGDTPAAPEAPISPPPVAPASPAASDAPVSPPPVAPASPAAGEAPVSPPPGAPASPAAGDAPVSPPPVAPASPAAGDAPGSPALAGGPPVSSAPPAAGDAPVPPGPPAAGDLPVAPASPAAAETPVSPPASPAGAAPVSPSPVAPGSPAAGDVPESSAPAGGPPVSSAPPAAGDASVSPPPVAPASPAADDAPESPASAGGPPVSSAPPITPATPAADGEAAPGSPAPSEGVEVVTDVTAAGDLAPGVPTFVDVGTVRAAAVAAGLRLPAGVYASVAAALTAGKHLLFTGAPGSGKTTLAMAVARAAAQEGKARGATVVTGDPGGQLVPAAEQGRWVIVDELDGADFEAALAPLSSFLGGVPVTFSEGEATPAEHWRVLATWNGATPPRAAVLRRFAVITVHPPAAEELRAAIKHAAHHDATATAAAEKLTHYADRVGTGVLLDAARHAAARQAAAPTDPDTLAHELIVAYIAPLIEP